MIFVIILYIISAIIIISSFIEEEDTSTPLGILLLVGGSSALYHYWNGHINWATIQFPLLIYTIISTIYFFVKWALECRKRGKLAGTSTYFYVKYIQEVDGKPMLIQPDFYFLFVHSLIFPLSIIASALDDVLKPLYNWFKRTAQNIANWFLPKSISDKNEEVKVVGNKVI